MDVSDDIEGMKKGWEEAGCLGQIIILLICIPLAIILIPLFLIGGLFFLFIIIGAILVRKQSGISFYERHSDMRAMNEYLNDPFLAHHRDAMGEQIKKMFD